VRIHDMCLVGGQGAQAGLVQYCVRMWVSSWMWNFVGCAIFMDLMYAGGIYKHKDW
jgi:formate/nitrite transporter FocA (FNT family)